MPRIRIAESRNSAFLIAACARSSDASNELAVRLTVLSRQSELHPAATLKAPLPTNCPSACSRPE